MTRIFALWGAAATLLAAPDQLVEWRRADPSYEWSFPADHRSHDGYKTEWWYFTGLLQGPTDPEATFGYQFTIFRIGVVPETPENRSSWTTANVLMGHLAVTDLGSGRHTFSEVLYRASPPFAAFGVTDDPNVIAWSLAPPGTEGRWELRKTEGGFKLAGVGPGVGLDLVAETSSPPVFQGPGGYSRKAHGPGRASLYYSYPSLHTTGTIIVEGQPLEVSGTSWMDHEFFSNSLEEDQTGWDWFSIRLDDGRSVMAFQLRGEDEKAGFRHLTLVGQDGSPEYLAEGEWSLTPGDRWSSPSTGAEYPVGWTLQVPGHGVDLRIQAQIRAQENVSALVDNLFYWEGAISVESDSGVPLGEGYLEMTGYGKGSRPAI